MQAIPALLQQPARAHPDLLQHAGRSAASEVCIALGDWASCLTRTGLEGCADVGVLQCSSMQQLLQQSPALILHQSVSLRRDTTRWILPQHKPTAEAERLSR